MKQRIPPPLVGRGWKLPHGFAAAAGAIDFLHPLLFLKFGGTFHARLVRVGAFVVGLLVFGLVDLVGASQLLAFGHGRKSFFLVRSDHFWGVSAGGLVPPRWIPPALLCFLVRILGRLDNMLDGWFIDARAYCIDTRVF